MKTLGLKVLREDELGVKTLGSREAEIEMRKVYATYLLPVRVLPSKHFRSLKFLLLLISMLKILRMYILI